MNIVYVYMSSVDHSFGGENAFDHANGDYDAERVLAEFRRGGVPKESFGAGQNPDVVRDIADARDNIFQVLSRGMAGFLRRG